MSERAGAITIHGKPFTLAGPELKVGDKAPDFTALDTGLNPVKLSAFGGKVVVLASVPSLDTPVCDLEIRRFNTEAASLGDDVAVVAISVDLPFAQARWCGAAGANAITTVSDHRDTAFGLAYGVLIDGLRLLSRAIFVVDKAGDVAYVQIVPEVTDEPDYDAVLEAVRRLV